MSGFGESAFAVLPFAAPAEEETGGQTITCTAIAGADAYGTAALNPGAVTVSPTGVSAADAYGTATVNPGVVTIIPLSLSSGEAYGTAVIVFDQVVSVLGIDSAEAFGATVIGDYLVITTVTSTIVMPVATAVARGIVKIYT